MKPLPLLITLSLVALGGAFLLISNKATPEDSSSETPPLAPLPPRAEDFENPPPLPTPPLLEEDLIPDPLLISFVEKELATSFSKPPIFSPVPAEEIITTVNQGFFNHFTTEQVIELNTVARQLGVLPPFSPLDQTLTTILAGEVRGLVTPTRSLIIETFQSSSPPEQAALVNLLAQRLLSEQIPFPQEGDSIDRILARYYQVQTLAFAVEKKFRETLPSYEPSLDENIRQSILLGLPAFFHELSTFAEFHLLERFQTASPGIILPTLAEKTTSRATLAHPFATPAQPDSYQLGAIPLYLILLESADPTTARTLATSLRGDSYQLTEKGLIWTLTFDTDKTPPRAAEFFRSYYSLRDPERKVALVIEGKTLRVESALSTP